LKVTNMNDNEKQARCKEAAKKMKTYESRGLPIRFSCRVYSRKNVICSDCSFNTEQ
jgi:hypothetical protein